MCAYSIKIYFGPGFCTFFLCLKKHNKVISRKAAVASIGPFVTLMNLGWVDGVWLLVTGNTFFGKTRHPPPPNNLLNWAANGWVD